VTSTLKIPFLPIGSHTVTVYYGWQYLGNHQRFEVFASATIKFFVVESPPSPSPTSITTQTSQPVSTTQTPSQSTNNSFSSIAMILSGIIAGAVIAAVALVIVKKSKE
jgi:hypothetical protein